MKEFVATHVCLRDCAVCIADLKKGDRVMIDGNNHTLIIENKPASHGSWCCDPTDTEDSFQPILSPVRYDAKRSRKSLRG